MPTRFRFVLLLIMLLIALPRAGRSAPTVPHDVYFGTLSQADRGNGTLPMNMINLNVHTSMKGIHNFHVSPDTPIYTPEIVGKSRRCSNLGEIAGMRWVWVSSVDGENAIEVDATSFESYEGYVTQVSPESATLKVFRHWIGRRYFIYSEKKSKSRTFSVPAAVPHFFDGKPSDLSLIREGISVKILTLDGSNALRLDSTWNPWNPPWSFPN